MIGKKFVVSNKSYNHFNKLELRQKVRYMLENRRGIWRGSAPQCRNTKLRKNKDCIRTRTRTHALPLTIISQAANGAIFKAGDKVQYKETGGTYMRNSCFCISTYFRGPNF